MVAQWQRETIKVLPMERLSAVMKGDKSLFYKVWQPLLNYLPREVVDLSLKGCPMSCLSLGSSCHLIVVSKYADVDVRFLLYIVTSWPLLFLLFVCVLVCFLLLKANRQLIILSTQSLYLYLPIVYMPILSCCFLFSFISWKSNTKIQK